jgi:phosphoglycolate phosphatase
MVDLSDAVIIFDLDGTLVDTAEDLAAAMNHALAMAGGRPLAAERVRHLVGLGARVMLTQAFAENGAPPPADLRRHLAVFLDHYRAHIADKSRPFPGAVEAVRALRAEGAKTAICTNKREALARLLLGRLGVLDLFETVVGLDTTTAGKPDPAPVRLCLDLTGAKRGVMIGDSDVDATAAAAAALPCLAATFGYGPLTADAPTLTRFSAFAELPRLVRDTLR